MYQKGVYMYQKGVYIYQNSKMMRFQRTIQNIVENIESII